MSIEIKGTIKRIFPVETVGSGNFEKRVIHIETDGQYPQVLSVEASGKCLPYCDSLKQGDSVEASVDLRGREWTDKNGEIKVFNTISVWKISKQGGSGNQVEPTNSNDDSDELPY